MVKMHQENIGQDVMDFNLAKAGYTAFYVDGTNGLDTYPGDSWDQPFKTIQHAIDEAGSWAKIFVKAGTYNETVDVTDVHDIHIIGEDRDVVILDGGSAAALIGNGTNCVYEEMTLKTSSNAFLTNLAGKRNTFRSCVVDSAGIGLVVDGDNTVIDDVRVDSVGTGWGAIDVGGDYSRVSNCIIDCGCANGISLIANTHYTKIFGNTIVGCSGKGIDVNQATATHNTIFHNNLISNTHQIRDNGSNNEWIENYYDNHTTDTNNDGLTDTPYTEGGATDYQPVSRRNGWKQESLGYDSGIGGGSSITDNAFSSAPSQDYTTEQTVFEIADDTRYKIIGAWIDITPFTAADTITFQFYRAIDAAGATYRKAGAAISKVKGTDNPIVEFADFAHYGYTKITAISSPGRTVVVPFGYIKEALE